MSRHCIVGKTYSLDLLKYLSFESTYSSLWAELMNPSLRYVLYEVNSDLMLYLCVQYKLSPFLTQEEHKIMIDQN